MLVDLRWKLTSRDGIQSLEKAIVLTFCGRTKSQEHIVRRENIAGPTCTALKSEIVRQKDKNR